MLGGTECLSENTAGVGWLTADKCATPVLYAKRTNTERFCGHNGVEILAMPEGGWMTINQGKVTVITYLR